MNCIFCDISSGKAEAEVIFENDRIIAFLDVRPMNFGHALVIPKSHYDNILNVPSIDLQALIDAVQFITMGINSALEPDGFNIVSNNGTAAGQSVFHYHFHIIPRYKNDSFKFNLNLKQYDDGMMKEYADKIREALIA